MSCAILLSLLMSCHSDSVGVPPYEVLTPEDLKISRFPAPLDAGIRETLRLHGPIAAELGLPGFLVREPPTVLFTDTDQEDREWQLRLAVHTRRLYRARYGAENRRAQPLALFHLMDRGKYEKLIDWIVTKETWLSKWAPTAKGLEGFANAPQRVVVLETSAAPRDLNRDNNFVHLIGHVAVFEHYGVQPFWVREGTALDLEVTILDKLFNMCNNGGFTALDRPGGWRLDVKKAFQKWQDLDPHTLVDLRQNQFDRDGSLRALGVTRYAVLERLDDYRSLLGRMRADREVNLRKDPHYICASETQLELLGECLGEGWEKNAVGSLQTGDSGAEVEAEQQQWRLQRKPAKEPAKSSRRRRR